METSHTITLLSLLLRQMCEEPIFLQVRLFEQEVDAIGQSVECLTLLINGTLS